MFEKSLLAIAALIAVGYASFSPLRWWQDIVEYGISWREIVFLSIVLSAVLAPFTPLVAAIIRRFTSWRLRRWQALALSLLLGAVGILMALVSAAFSGPGFFFALVKGTMVALAVMAAFLLLSRQTSQSIAEVYAFLLMIPPAIVAAWSIVSAGAVAFNAKGISDGEPYCLAIHGEEKPVSSLSELRGLEFYTTFTGYKDTSRWFFHGVMIVRRKHGLEVYNWTPRKMQFDRVDNYTLRNIIENPSSECVPRYGFLRSLSII